MKTLFRFLLALAVLYGVISLAAGYRLAQTALHPPRRFLPPSASSEFHAPVEEASVTGRDGAVLRAWFVRSDHPNGAAVILLHGVADNRQGVSGYAAMFLRHGYAVLLPDSRAQGVSGGSVVTYGVLERWDVRRWARWLQSRVSGCEYLFGESLGAAIAIQASAVTPGVCAVAAESSFATFRQIANIRISQYTGLGPWFPRTVAAPARDLAFLFSREFNHANLTAADPLRAIRGSRVPTLLIAGTADNNIPMTQSEELYRAGASHAQLWIVPGAQHTGAVTADPAGFENHVVTWFQRHSAAP